MTTEIATTGTVSAGREAGIKRKIDELKAEGADDVLGYVHAGVLADSTLALYRHKLDVFEGWLRVTDFDMSGDCYWHRLTDAVVAKFITHRAQLGLAAATLNGELAAIRYFSRWNGVPVDWPVTEKTIRGIRRSRADRQSRQVKGLTFEECDRICEVALTRDPNRIRGLRNAAIMMTASCGMLRIGEVVALRVGDFNLDDNTLTIRKSKTDRMGRGATVWLNDRAVGWTRTWFDLAGLDAFPEKPAFRPVRKNGYVNVDGGPMTVVGVRKMYRECAARAGIEAASRVSGHSFRIGSAQSLAARHHSVAELQQVGRWKSPSMPAHYIRNELASRSAMAMSRDGRAFSRASAPPLWPSCDSASPPSHDSAE